MKPTTTNQEILLFTGTSFSHRELCKRGKHNSRPEPNSSMDELEKACWAGALLELLPELSPGYFTGHNMHIWNILLAEHFLLIDQGTGPHPHEAGLSLDPHLFLAVKNFN